MPALPRTSLCFFLLIVHIGLATPPLKTHVSTMCQHYTSPAASSDALQSADGDAEGGSAVPVLEIVCPCLQDASDVDVGANVPLTLRLGVERSQGRVHVFSVNHGLDRKMASEILANRLDQGYPAAISATLRRCASWLLEQRARESRFELCRHAPLTNMDEVAHASEVEMSFFAYSKHYPDFVLLVTIGEELEPTFTLIHTVPAGPVITRTGKNTSSHQPTPAHVALSPMSAAFATLSPGSGFTPGLDASPQVAGDGGVGTAAPAAAGLDASSRTLARELQGLVWTPAASKSQNQTDALPSPLPDARRVDFFCPLVVSRVALSWLDAIDAQR